MESLQSTFKHKLSHNYFKQGPAGGTEKGGRPGENYFMNKNYIVIKIPKVPPYLIFVIFFTLAKFLENKIYTEKRQFFALNL